MIDWIKRIFFSPPATAPQSERGKPYTPKAIGERRAVLRREQAIRQRLQALEIEAATAERKADNEP